MAKTFKEFRDYLYVVQRRGLPVLDEVFFVDGEGYDLLSEGKKFFSGSFDRNIRRDIPNYPQGQAHYHVRGRNGKDIVVVNTDGSSSHGSKGVVPRKDADVLRSLGVPIPKNRIIEFFVIGNVSELLAE